VCEDDENLKGVLKNGSQKRDTMAQIEGKYVVIRSRVV
jgi:hypothetical protein